MKTSKYILIAFFVFFFGIITALHIDSKIYEPEYNKIQAKKLEIKTHRNNLFYGLKDSKENKGDIDKWNHFISNVKTYCSYNIINVSDINNWSWHIAENYTLYKDKDAALLAEKWCELAYNIKPNDHYLGDTYALLLFKLGHVEEAVKVQRKAVERVVIKNPELGKWYKQRLRRFERALNKDYEGDTKDLTIVIDNVKHAKSDKKKWNKLLELAGTKFENEKVNVWFLKDVCWLIVESYKNLNDISAIKKAEEWCKKALSESLDSYMVNDCYAHVLFAQGKMKSALKYGEITVEIAEEENPKYLKWCMPRLVKYKEAMEKIKNVQSQ